MTDYTGLGRSQLLALLTEGDGAQALLREEVCRLRGQLAHGLSHGGIRDATLTAAERARDAAIASGAESEAMLLKQVEHTATAERERDEARARADDREKARAELDVMLCKKFAEEIKLKHERDDARSCARALAFCWDHDTAPTEDILATARQWDARGQVSGEKKA